jgi:hypothetical protein
VKLCIGCKHLRVLDGLGWCQEPDECRTVPVRDETTGIVSHHWVPLKHGLRWRENTTARCRAPGMPCGPEARLWAPNFWRRIFGRSGA